MLDAFVFSSPNDKLQAVYVAGEQVFASSQQDDLKRATSDQIMQDYKTTMQNLW